MLRCNKNHQKKSHLVSSVVFEKVLLSFVNECSVTGCSGAASRLAQNVQLMWRSTIKIVRRCLQKLPTQHISHLIRATSAAPAAPAAALVRPAADTKETRVQWRHQCGVVLSVDPAAVLCWSAVLTTGGETADSARTPRQCASHRHPEHSAVQWRSEGCRAGRQGSHPLR